MKRSDILTPDDIQDLKVFAEAVCAKIPNDKVSDLLDSYLRMSLNVINFWEVYYSNKSIKEDNFGLACVVELYQFLRKNEFAIRKLMVITEEGEPFVCESN